jgi:hypothetical protein
MAARVPIRVPPPPAGSLVEQWIIDALMHVDDCLDELKRDTKNSLSELKAEVSANAVLGHSQDQDLLQQIETHKRFHETMDRVEATRRGVWQQIWTGSREAFRLLTSGAVITVVAWILKQMGVI